MPKKFLTVKEVSGLLGVTPLTVRNWDAAGKLTAYRNPMNNYRLYKVEDIEKLIKRMEEKPSHSPKEPEKSKFKKLKIDVL